jgi:hypothetical protein
MEEALAHRGFASCESGIFRSLLSLAFFRPSEYDNQQMTNIVIS